MLMQYIEAEKKVFERNQLAISIRARRSSDYANYIQDLRAKFLNLEHKQEEAQKLIWEKDCESAKRLSGHKADMAVVALMQNVPSDFLKEHFDIESYWKGRGTELSRNELLALRAGNSMSPEFLQLKEIMQQNPTIDALVKSTYAPSFARGLQDMQHEFEAKMKTLADVQQRFGYDMTGGRETKESTLTNEDLQRNDMERA